MEKVLGKTTMAQEDPLFSMLQGLASSIYARRRGASVRRVESWADHMESADRIAEYVPGTTDSANQPLQGLDVCYDREDPMDIGLDIHGLSEDEQEKLLFDQYTTAAASENPS